MESLWRNQQFVRLWLASAISSLGGKVTATAIPLTAAVTLSASPAQMAMLVIAGQLPDVVFGLPAGSWIDRGRHRQFLAGADAGRAVLLATVPLAAILGMLSMPLLFVVAFVGGTLAVFSSVASVAVLPSVVRSEQLVDANAKLTMTGSIVAIAGPGFAGGFIQLVSAPKAILLDAISNAASAMSLRRVGSTERMREQERSLIHDIKEGLRELIATPVLRALTLSSAVFAVGLAMNATILMLFLTNELGMKPATIGVYLAAGGIGTLAGSLIARRVSARIGVGAAIIGGTLIEAVAAFAIPVSTLLPNPVSLLLAAQVLNGIGIAIYSVNHVSLRQRTVRPDYLARVTAGRRFLTFSVAPLGAVLAGWMGQSVGLAAAMTGSAVMMLTGTVVMWASPVRAER